MSFLSRLNYSIEAWQQIRAKGKARFVLTRGVIVFGGLLLAIDLLF